VRAATTRAECDMRAAWARVEDATLQALSLFRSLARSLSLSLRTVRNGACLRRSSLDKECRDNPPPPLSWSACLNEIQVCVRMCMRVGVGVRVCVLRKPTDVDTDCRDTPPQNALYALTSCPCPCVCVRAWSCEGMRVRVHVNSTVPPGPKVDHLDIVGIRRTSARTCALHFYIKLLPVKMVSNTSVISSCIIRKKQPLFSYPRV
jgi:hypothetical protein